MSSLATSGLAQYPTLSQITPTKTLATLTFAAAHGSSLRPPWPLLRGLLFIVAASFTKKCESVLSLIGTYTRGRHDILSDASNIVNIGHACYKLVFASVGLSITYWNADSNFETQPTSLKLSVSLKTASNWLILPLLTVTTLLLLYFINWGWNLRFEGHDNINVHTEETAAERKK